MIDGRALPTSQRSFDLKGSVLLKSMVSSAYTAILSNFQIHFTIRTYVPSKTAHYSGNYRWFESRGGKPEMLK